MINNDLYFFLIGAIGAGSLELLKLYEIRGKLDHKKYRELRRSKLFWTVVVGMLFASGFFAWAYAVSDLGTGKIWDIVIVGIAARSFVRQSVAAKLANAPKQCGATVDSRQTLQEIFL